MATIPAVEKPLTETERSIIRQAIEQAETEGDRTFEEVMRNDFPNDESYYRAMAEWLEIKLN